MGLNSSLSAEIIVSRLKKALNVKTDAELAELLGVRSNTVAGWKKRNSIPFETILEKCPSVSLDWLFSVDEVGPGVRMVQEDFADYSTVVLPPDNFKIPLYECLPNSSNHHAADLISSKSFWLRNSLSKILGEDPFHFFAVQIQDDAMVDQFEAGETALGVYQQYEDPGIYAFAHEGHVLVRNVTKVSNQYVLGGWAHDYPVEFLSVRSDHTFIGRILGSMLRRMR